MARFAYQSQHLFKQKTTIALLCCIWMLLVATSSSLAAEEDELRELISDVQAKLVNKDEKTTAVKSWLDKITSEFEKDGEGIDKYIDVAQAIGGSIENIQSDDPATVIVGFLDIMQALSGTVAELSGYGAIFGLLSSVFGMLQSQEVEKTVDVLIKEALEAQQAEDLQAEAYGTRKVFQVSKAFLDGIRKEETEIKTWEISAIAANVPIYKGAKFMAILGQYIKEKRPENKEETMRTIKLIEAYCKLCGLRKILLYDLYTTISSNEKSPSIARGIYEVLNSSDAEFREPLLPLTKGDDNGRFELLMTLYPKEQNPAIFEYFKAVNVSDIPGFSANYSGDYYMKCLEYEDHYFGKHKDNRGGEVNLGGTPTKTKVNLRRLPDGYYTMLVDEDTIEWSDYYNYLVFKSETTISDKNRFHLLPFKDGDKEFFLIKMKCQSQCQDNQYLYMKSNTYGTIKEDTYEGAGDQGKWIIEKVEERAIL